MDAFFGDMGAGGERECGSRKEGGVYVEVPTSPVGMPVDYFLIDPPQRITTDEQQALGITPIGVSTITDSAGTVHVVDWIGQNYYPNVEDWITETRRMGISRRIPVTFDFSQLTPASRLLVVHAKAYIDNWAAYVAQPAHALTCYKAIAGHPAEGRPVTDMCVSLWRQDVAEGTPVEPPVRRVRRELVSGPYDGFAAPPGVDGHYTPAFFGSFPIANLAVVRAEDGSHEDAVEKARKAQIRVIEVDK